MTHVMFNFIIFITDHKHIIHTNSENEERKYLGTNQLMCTIMTTYHVLTWVVVMLKDTPQAAVNPKAAAEASATNSKPTYMMKNIQY